MPEYPYKFYVDPSSGQPYLAPGTNTPYGQSETDFGGALSSQLGVMKRVLPTTSADLTSFQDLYNRYQSGGLTDEDYNRLATTTFKSPSYNLTGEQLKSMAGGGQVASPLSNWQGAIVNTVKIPELQAQGATVSGGNVVGPNVPGLGGQPMSESQKAATSPNALQLAIQNAAGTDGITSNIVGGGVNPGGTNVPLPGQQSKTQPSKVQGFKRVGDDVYDAQGNYVDMKKAQELGIVDQLAGIPQASTAEADVLTKKKDGISTTSRTQVEQNEFIKSLTERFKKADEMQAQILASLEKTDEEKALRKQAKDISASFDAGLVDIQGQTIPMQLITGQGAELEKKANNRLKVINETLKIFQDDREEKFNILSKAYDLSRNSVNDTIALYNLTKPEKLAFDSETGIVFMQNPMTGEVYQTKVPGFQGNESFTKDLMAKYPDAGISPTDTYSVASQKLQNSKIYQQQTRLADGTGTEDKKIEEEKKTIADFSKALSSWDYSTNANREQFIRQLQGAYPTINPGDIARKVYEIYPDGFNKLK